MSTWEPTENDTNNDDEADRKVYFDATMVTAITMMTRTTMTIEIATISQATEWWGFTVATGWCTQPTPERVDLDNPNKTNLRGRSLCPQNGGDSQVVVLIIDQMLVRMWRSAGGDEILVEVDHVEKRKLGTNVGIHHEKGLGIAGSDLIPEMIDGTSCP